MRARLTEAMFAGLLLCLVSPFLFAQATTPITLREDNTPRNASRATVVQPSRSPSPGNGQGTGDTRVSVTLSRVSLQEALRQIAAEAGLRLTYRTNGLPQRRISRQFDSVRVSSAFSDVLKGTGLRVDIIAPGHAAIVKDTTTPTTDSTHTGALSGSVTDSATGNGLVGVTVMISELNRHMTTDERGRFIMRVPPGQYSISFRMIGYGTTVRRVTIPENGVVRENVVLVQNANVLSSVLTTATGQRRSFEIGSDITRIDVDEVRKYTDVISVADILADRVPGMFIQSGGGDAGAGNRIRIRGMHSITLSNDPILIIDGVRIKTIGQDTSGGRTTVNSLSSRLDDIDPASIETIEVFKGPSAATLYGPDAANGVIVITRKRARAGETRWTFSAASRVTGIPREFPNQRTVWGRSPESNDPVSCDRYNVEQGVCLGPDSVTYYNQLNDQQYTTVGRGYNNNFGMTMSTGTAQMQSFLTVSLIDELGPAKLSDVGVERVLAIKGYVPYFTRRPNAKKQMSGNANITIQSLPVFDVGLQANVMHLNLRNNGQGIGTGNVDTSQFVPEEQFLTRKGELTDRSSVSVSLNTRKLSWFNWNGVFGVDYGKVSRDDWLRAEDCLQEDCSKALGSRSRGVLSGATYSVRSFVGITTPLWSWATLRSSIGVDYSRNNSESVRISGTGMPAGGYDPGLATRVTSEGRSSTSAQAGAYVEERLSFGHRLFMTGAIRRDAGSGLGSRTKNPLFPKFDLSWVALDRPVTIPGIGILNGIRLRTAHGQSGLQPTIRQWNATVTKGTEWYDGASHTAYLYNSLGNALIRPERTKEIEFGADLEFQGRIERVSITHFRHVTHEAIVNYNTSGESGLPNLTRVENLGKLQNSGFEAATSLRLIDTRSTSWRINANYSSTKNKVLSLGRFPQMPASTFSNVSRRVAVGYPVFGVWTQPVLGYEDRNQNGTLESNEYVLGDSLVYAGWSQPKYRLGYQSSLSLWQGNLRLSSSFSQNVGLTKQARLGGSQGIGDIDGQIDEEIMRFDKVQTVSSFAWTSADVTTQLPTRWLRYVRARNGTISVSCSNLYLWTNYRGNDPTVGPTGPEMSNYDATGVTPNTRNWAFRVNVTY